MTTTRDAIAAEAADRTYDAKGHRALRFWLGVLTLGLLILGATAVIQALRDGDQKDAIIQLAEDQRAAVAAGETLADQLRDLGVRPRTEIPPPVDNIDPDDPEIQDSEQQDGEIQDPEVQDPDPNDPEVQDGDPDDPEQQQDEVNDLDPDDPEIQDEEVQEDEIQESEIQEPENQNAPVCPPGYSQQPFVWNGPDNVPGTEDDRNWILCMEDEPS
jgi:hypothetical protein